MVPAYGTVLVGKDPNADVAAGTCLVPGMRVDPRTNYLFVAGCTSGLYVNNARYSGFPGGDTQYWVTTPKLRP